MDTFFLLLAFLLGIILGAAIILALTPRMMSKLDPAQLRRLGERVRSHKR